MVPKTAVSEIRDEGFRLIKPVMYLQVVLGLSSKFSGAAFCVLQWMSHG
jgi:hypothetical protein